MELYQEPLFLLVKYPLGEADFIAHLLSRSQGPLQARVQGGQQLKKGFAYEPGDQIEATFEGQEGSEFIRLKEVRPLFQRDPQPLGYVSILGLATMMELANRLGRRGWDAAGLFDLLRASQTWDWSRPSLLQRLFDFLWLLTDLGGIKPEYRQCMTCHRESYLVKGEGIQVRKSFYLLNHAQGGLVCGGCGEGGDLNGSSVKLFWLADQQQPLEAVPADIMLQALWQLFDYLAFHSHFQLKALPLLREALKA